MATVSSVNGIKLKPLDDLNHPVIESGNGNDKIIVIDNFETSVEKINNLVLSALANFNAIGYYLKLICNDKLYEQYGYESIWDAADQEFGFSKSTASRYMQMNTAYSENGNSPLLAPEFKKFSKSQLQEMLSLPDNLRDEITPDMTVMDIRDFRKPTDEEITKFWENKNELHNIERDNLKDYLKEHFSHSGCHSDGLNYQGSPRGIQFAGCIEITWKKLVERINQLLPQPETCSIEPAEEFYPNANPSESVATSQQSDVLPGQTEVTDFFDKNADFTGFEPKEDSNPHSDEDHADEDCYFDQDDYRADFFDVPGQEKGEECDDNHDDNITLELSPEEIRGLRDFIEQNKLILEGKGDEWKSKDSSMYYKRLMPVRACEYMLNHGEK